MSEIAKTHQVELKNLHEQEWFQRWLKDIDTEVPTIPPFDPNDHVTDDGKWQYYSGLKEGFELALSHLGVRHD